MDMEPDMSISNLISLLSGIALFLFGMSLMGDGLKKVAGNKLEVILYQLTGKPLKGFLLGTAVTAVIQSSSATSVMVVGFVNSGMMRVRQAISIVMGAILGTSITGWIICLSDLGGGGGWVDLFSTATLTGIISVAGILLRMFSKNQTKQHVGDILMGFAVLMFGMSTMSAAVSPLRDEPVFLRILTSFSNPLLGILFGTFFTCVLQSASAALLGWLPGVLGDIPLLRIGLPAVLSLYFDIFSGLLQAFIFAMLTMLYISGGFPADDYAARKRKKAERKQRAAAADAGK